MAPLIGQNRRSHASFATSSAPALLTSLQTNPVVCGAHLEKYRSVSPLKRQADKCRCRDGGRVCQALHYRTPHDLPASIAVHPPSPLKLKCLPNYRPTSFPFLYSVLSLSCPRAKVCVNLSSADKRPCHMRPYPVGAAAYLWGSTLILLASFTTCLLERVQLGGVVFPYALARFVVAPPGRHWASLLTCAPPVVWPLPRAGAGAADRDSPLDSTYRPAALPPWHRPMGGLDELPREGHRAPHNVKGVVW